MTFYEFETIQNSYDLKIG